jgi:hypothetical protein
VNPNLESIYILGLVLLSRRIICHKQTRGGDTEEDEDGSRQEMATLWVVLKKTKTEADKRRRHWVVLKKMKTEADKRRRHYVVLKKRKTEADKIRKVFKSMCTFAANKEQCKNGPKGNAKMYDICHQLASVDHLGRLSVPPSVAVSHYCTDIY